MAKSFKNRNEIKIVDDDESDCKRSRMVSKVILFNLNLRKRVKSIHLPFKLLSSLAC